MMMMSLTGGIEPKFALNALCHVTFAIAALCLIFIT